MQRAVTSVCALVARTIDRYAMLAGGERVLVGVSGGSDSVGLLAALARLQRSLAIELVAAHVNHRLRGSDAEEDERCAAENAQRLGVPFVRCDLPASLRTASNLEARARVLRYAALHRLASGSDCGTIATGHTRDDQAETLLLRLIRGSGPGGLAGVQPKRRDHVIRPLIECTRADIEAFVRALGLPYRTDTSNWDPRFHRTRIRHEVLPLLRQLNPNVESRLIGTAALFAAEREIVREWVAAQVDRIASGRQLDLERLATVPAPLHGYVIHHWIERAAGPSQRLTAAHVEAVSRLAGGLRTSGMVSLGGGLRVERRYTILALVSKPPTTSGFATQLLRPGESATVRGWRIAIGRVTPAVGRAALPRDLWSAVCAADTLSDAFAVRPPRNGDRVRPLGLDGTRKLSDVFIDRKIPASDRRAYPVVEWAGQILWVPGVVRSEVLLVSEQTQRTVSIVATREC